MDPSSPKQHPKVIIDAILSKCENNDFKDPNLLRNDMANRFLSEHQKAILQNSKKPVINDDLLHPYKFFKTEQKNSLKGSGQFAEGYLKKSMNKSSFNISDLITDETIHLEAGDSELIGNSTLQPHNDIKLSFEPNEMAGRSTLGTTDFKGHSLPGQRLSSNLQQVKEMSVSDILASSFAPKARDLCETLNLDDTVCADTSSWIASSVNNDIENLSACFNVNNDKISKKHESIEEAFNNFIISTPNNCSLANTHTSVFKRTGKSNADSLSEEFQPSELMHSKLINDEISWAQKYAAIPTKVLSQEAKIKYEKSNEKSGEWDNVNTFSKLTINNNHADLSVGAFFQMRSDNLHNIIEHKKSNSHQHESMLNKNMSPLILEEIISEDASKAKKVLNENDEDDLEKKTIYQSVMKSVNSIDNNLRNIYGNKEDTDNTLQNRSENTLVESNRLNISKPKLSKESVKKNSLKELISHDNKENIDPNSALYWNYIDTTDQNSYDTTSTSSKNSVVEAKEPLHLIKTKVDCNDYDNDKYNTPKRKNIVRSKTVNGATFTLNEITVTSTQCAEKPIISKTDNSVISTLRTRNKECEENIKELEVPKLIIEALRDQTLPNSTKSDYDLGVYQHNLENTMNKNSYMIKSGMLCSSSSMDKTTKTTDITVPEITKASSSAGKNSVQIKTSSNVNNSTAHSTAIKRCISNSTASEYRHQHGIQLPIKVTTCSLSWPSTKLRKDTHKSMQIKNISNKRLNFRLVICGPGFQFVPSTQRSNVMTLHAQECRTITVSFCPTVQGVAIGKISIIENSFNNDASILDISLFGIGGEAKVRLNGVLQGPIGSPFLQMGTYSDLANPIERSFNIRNKGNLPGFFIATINAFDLRTPPDNYCTQISPSRCIVLPDESITIYVRFRAKRDIIKKIIKKSDEVITLAVMHIILGDEYDRQRICRLLRHKQEHQETSKIMSMLLEKFPNEVITDDLGQFKEEPDVVNDLLSSFGIYSIALTLNNNLMLDETLVSSASMFVADAEETAFFRTICYDPDTDTNHIESSPLKSSLSSIVAEGLTLSPLSVSITSPKKVN